MTNADSVFEAARRLQHQGKPYALVSVVRALAPASARPGDKAVVTADGDLHGWVGGGCAQPAVVRTVRQVLSDGRARLIRIAPTADGHERDLGDVLEFGMACHSGGTLELFVDPVLPHAQLVVIGASPVAASLVQLAPRVGFRVTLVAHEAIAEAHPDAAQVIPSDDPAAVLPRVASGAWVVIATQGRRDIQALRLALALNARQVSFVASERKAGVLKDSLIAAGADAAAVAAIKAPAGYPMPATTPEEIALSVLAAVVAHRRGAMTVPAEVAPPAAGMAADAALAPRPAPREREPVLVSAPMASSCCGGAASAAEPLEVPQVAVPQDAATAPSSCCGA